MSHTGIEKRDAKIERKLLSHTGMEKSDEKLRNDQREKEKISDKKMISDKKEKKR